MTMIHRLTISPRKRAITKGKRRRGSIYVVVLGSAMVVMVIGLGALAGVGIERRTSQSASEFNRARLHARNAIEMGFYWINEDPNWRSARSASSAWATAKPVADGAFDLTVTDPDDGDIQLGTNATVLMTATGYCQQAKYTLQVQLADDQGALVVLDGSWKRIVK
jgi:Tfp pilus assembly protein PilX